MMGKICSRRELLSSRKNRAVSRTSGKLLQAAQLPTNAKNWTSALADPERTAGGLSKISTLSKKIDSKTTEFTGNCPLTRKKRDLQSSLEWQPLLAAI
jgi:hypothetical protein